MKIVFAGDLFLGGDKMDYSLQECIQVPGFKNADLRVVNLEHPITDFQQTPTKSSLYTGSSVLSELVQSNIDIVSLANNHIHDMGSNGIYDTLNHLQQVGIKYFGAGANLNEARMPVWVSSDLAILGYCQYASPTLNHIQLATEELPGVNPLTRSNILEDLSLLPNGKKVILVLHWGREHVWLTQPKNLKLAKELLAQEKVAGIIGSHPHRPQGLIRNGKKTAYFCLGNFLFPNFFISPPNIVLNNLDKKPSKFRTTRRYHPVEKITYKKWKRVNRTSILAYYNAQDSSFTHEFIYQDDNKPSIRPLRGFNLLVMNILMRYLNMCYNYPPRLYGFLELLFSSVRMRWWYLNLFIFQIRENGVLWGASRIKKRILEK